ncbi:MAG: DUF6384 family protein [Pseudomonadota bacterium]
MPQAQPDKAPLDEVMLAMDVVDTLRHQQLLVDRELHADERDRRLIERLHQLYASQGIDVPDSILAEGVAALKEDRFTYQPPPDNFQTALARLYIKRGKWSRWFAAAALALAVLWSGWYLAVQAPENRRLERLDALPAELAAEREAIGTIARAEGAKEAADSHYQAAMAAVSSGDIDAATGAYAMLQNLRQTVASSYTLRVVSRPGERSGVWRHPENNPGARNYYLVVEAIDASGKSMTLPVMNEEDGKSYNVSKWGLRVPHSVYKRVAADKQDDGIIQMRNIGVKKSGYLEPEYSISTTGAVITSW